MKRIFLIIMAIFGSFLSLLPSFLTIIVSLAHFVKSGKFLFDYLIPAELFPAPMTGAFLIAMAALMEQLNIKRLSSAFITMIVSLATALGIAYFSGMSSGARAAQGLPFIAAVVFIALYSISTIWVGYEGVRIARKLIK